MRAGLKTLIGEVPYNILWSLRHPIWSGYHFLGLPRYRLSLPAPILRIGGHGVSTEGITPTSIVYSYGIGEDLSFELEMIRRFGVTIHAFDPTPLALAWVKRQNLPSQLIVHEIGLAAYDGIARFNPPIKSNFVSYSIVGEPGVGDAVEAPVRRIQTMMKDLGHSKIDFLKLDVEGAEYPVLGDLLLVKPYQVMVEFHHRIRRIGHRNTRKFIQQFIDGGYRVACTSKDTHEITFLLVQN
jgi:FkbM family methyltransferase